MRVAVFGSSSPRPGEPLYQQAYRLGQRLARAGFTVVTGGYIGTMEAVSRGAYEAGGWVIGVPCAEIERWRPVGPNPWIHERWSTQTLLERLQRLVRDTDAAIVLPGGVGTLTEMALYWNHLAIAALPPRPFIVVGDAWRKALAAFTDLFASHVPRQAREQWTWVPHVDAAVQALQAWQSERSRASTAAGARSPKNP